MESYQRELIEAARNTRLQSQELCKLGRKLRDVANQYRQLSYRLSDLNRPRQSGRRRHLPMFSAQSQERRP
ncbi:MAG: hypothetical protein JWN45_1840 [Acidobacteriaceae bacterium]|nr:hypothetical protein [Acidobacteriaceae bacterium]